ncbi:NAD(P)-binding protein [Nocardia sp. NRRL WC-3656]|uniref:NAD(P)-binding protein n=1 Tax=Nocardia sp. NRRL WC-3656 TaxID=1463824 RepID=UPI0012DE983C|nr:NAD(P)-binding protein [Nocardia sp. NRRL WC-3656]
MTSKYDALVVGGGQSGLAAAQYLSRRSHAVAELEAGPETTASPPATGSQACSSCSTARPSPGSCASPPPTSPTPTTACSCGSAVNP